MWVLERFSAIPVSFSSIAFLSMTYPNALSTGWDIYGEKGPSTNLCKPDEQYCLMTHSLFLLSLSPPENGESGKGGGGGNSIQI